MESVPTAKSAVQVENRRRTSVLDRWRGVLLVLLAVCSSFWQLHAHDRIMGPNYSDLVTRWVGTRAAIAGLDPYSEDVLPDMLRMYYGHYPLTASDPNPERQRFYYPAILVVLLAPLAYFDWPTARVIFLVLTVSLLLLGFWRTIEMYPRRWTRPQVAMVLVLAVCSWPILWGLRLQQPTLLVAALVFLACSCVSRGKDLAGGVLLALTTVKPQIVMPILVWLFLWSIVHRRWKLLLWFGTAVGVLLLCTEMLVPGWFSHWRAAVGMYVRVTDTAPALENLFGHWAGLALTLLIAASICASLWRLRRANADSAEFAVAIGLVLTLTVLFIPTHLTIVYNQVLLFPACLFVIQAAPVDRDGRMMRWAVLVLLWVTFTLPLVAGICSTVAHPAPIWYALPFFGNSPLIGAVAMAAAILASRQKTPIRELLPAQP